MSTATEPTARIVSQTANEYHAMTERSRSQVNDFLESRWLFYRRHIDKDPMFAFKPTKETEFGTWWHEWILERGGDVNDTGLITYPPEVLNAQGHRKGKKCTDWEEAHAGEQIVKDSELQEIIEMYQAVERNPLAYGYVLSPQPTARNELTVCWDDQESGTRLRGRLDRVIPGVAIVDLKTTSDANPWALRRTIRDRRYYQQAAVYQRAWYAVSGEMLPFMLVFHETACPWRCRTRQISQQYMDRGYAEFVQALRDIEECERTGDWRDVDTSSETAEVIDDPRDYERE